jgi:hypothetical protein
MVARGQHYPILLTDSRRLRQSRRSRLPVVLFRLHPAQAKYSSRLWTCSDGNTEKAHVVTLRRMSRHGCCRIHTYATRLLHMQQYGLVSPKGLEALGRDTLTHVPFVQGQSSVVYPKKYRKLEERIAAATSALPPPAFTPYSEEIFDMPGYHYPALFGSPEQ